ncbi:MAG: STN domain-containing protein [Planctomycetia bacterium]|nr:STN domain-containing protein [Planctomycetia bacterium]
MRYDKLTAASVRALWAAIVAISTTAQAEQGGWVTGPTLDQQLAAGVTISLSKIPLSRALKSISTAQHIAIVLDRRVDPDQETQLGLTREPLRNGLQRIADQLQIGYCQFGPIAYFGPTSTVKRLRSLAALRLEDVRPLPPAASRKFLQMRSSHWDDLAEPRQLVEALAEEAGIALVGAKKIPHDLWPAADLPPLTWIDRLTLLAAQFGLTFRIDKGGQQVELTPMPAKVVLARTYQAPRQADSVAKRWAKALPTARVAVEGNKIRVEGSLEDHETVEHRLRGTPTQRTTVTVGKEVYQLAVEQAALSQVLEQLSQRLSLEFQWDRAAIERAGISLDQLIAVKVQNVTLDELLRAVLANTGLTFRHDDRAISIYPVEPKTR